MPGPPIGQSRRIWGGRTPWRHPNRAPAEHRAWYTHGLQAERIDSYLKVRLDM